ncbi:MAG: hypothetical protein M5R36_08755 [Deltaproteobacteria bacterium]|nr:hypothetical protein [Deltaproteobacteria bacterium]
MERRRLAEEAERLRREAEERARADAEALRRAEEEARRRAEEESRRRAAEEEARRKAEDAARVRREQEEREAREKAERDRREAERMLREREAAAPPVDDGMAAPAAEPAIPESPRTKNMPGAADYLELLAARKRTLPEDAPAPAPKTFDFPPPEEPEDIIPSDGADEEEDAAEDEVAEEELDDEPEAPETETRTAPRSAAPNIKRGGLTVRTFGAAVDLAILGLVVGLFLLIGRSLLTVGGSAPEWSGFLKITGPIYILFFAPRRRVLHLLPGQHGPVAGDDGFRPQGR